MNLEYVIKHRSKIRIILVLIVILTFIGFRIYQSIVPVKEPGIKNEKNKLQAILNLKLSNEFDTCLCEVNNKYNQMLIEYYKRFNCDAPYIYSGKYKKGEKDSIWQVLGTVKTNEWKFMRPIGKLYYQKGVKYKEELFYSYGTILIDYIKNDTIESIIDR